jgi:hypothetical protein
MSVGKKWAIFSFYDKSFKSPSATLARKMWTKLPKVQNGSQKHYIIHPGGNNGTKII